MISKFFTKRSQDFFQAIDVPKNLASITSVDDATEVDANEAGLSNAAVNAIWASVENFYATGMHPGITFCLRRRGKVVLNRSIGYSRGVKNDEDSPLTLITPQTPVCLYSSSKAVMAMLVHKAAEEGHLNLLNPVSHYIPEFAQNGKKNISIYQMLAHRGGFPMMGEELPVELMFDREAILDKICKAKGLSEEGRIQAYHAVTSGYIADELIRRSVGVSIEEYLHEKFTKPLGMKHFTFGLEEEYRDEVARNYVTGMRNGRLLGGMIENILGLPVEDVVKLSNTDSFYNSVIPSANMFSTAEEIGRFYQMLLDNGRYEDKQLLEPETVKNAVREAGKTQLDANLKLPVRFSAGFMLGNKPVGMYGINSHHAYGHFGFSNIFSWADPERDISVSLLSTGKPVVGKHFLALLQLMRTISKECPPCESYSMG